MMITNKALHKEIDLSQICKNDGEKHSRVQGMKRRNEDNSWPDETKRRNKGKMQKNRKHKNLNKMTMEVM